MPLASWECGSKETLNYLMRKFVTKKRLMNAVDEDEITMI
jgi:IS30 family transposase